MYADDVVLVAPSAPALQDMLDVFSQFTSDKDIRLNVMKSCVLAWGAGHRKAGHFTYDGTCLPTRNNVKYLGVELRTGSVFGSSVEGKVASFYRASNALLGRAGVAGLSAHPGLLFHLYTLYCMPILRYCYAVLRVSLTKRDDARVVIAHNAMVRRVFHLSRYDRVPDAYAFSRYAGT